MADEKPNGGDKELPAQLRRQIEEADALRAQMSSPPEGGEEAPSQDQPATEGQPPQPASLPGQPAEEDQSWEQRYNSLKGRFETNQRNYQAQNERIGQLENLIATLKIKGAEEPGQELPQPKQRPKLVTEDEERDYGAELLTVVGKKAREEVMPEFEQLAERLKRLESGQQAVGQIIDRTQTQTVYQTLAEHIPDWQAINQAPEFKHWVAQPDPYSGRSRKEMLLEAFDRHESGRVVAFFRGFLTEATGTPPTSSSPGSSAPPLAGTGNGSGKPSLEEFAAPGRARSAPQQLPPDKPIYTSASIAKFMADKRTGKYRGREADAEAIERDIYAAQHEGRIQ